MMAASAIPERLPTPPHSNDGEHGAPEPVLQLESHLSEPYTPPQSLHSIPKMEEAAVSDGDSLETQPSSQNQDSYPDPSLYQAAAPVNNFYPIQPIFVRTPQMHTPPAASDEDRIHTRSGKALGSPMSPPYRSSPRITRSPRMKSTPRASRKAKAGKSGAPLLEQPLSILTKDYKIPVKDMDAWVHRSVAERLEEASRNKGHVARPMNSFMLYRSAYADRSKHFCKENNHQVVSQITGASWPLEPKEVREMYEEYARIERNAHSNAHPDYKFAPNKKGNAKRSHYDDDDDDDPEWNPKRSRTGTSGPSRSHSSTPFNDRFQPPYQPTMHPSSYWASNPHNQNQMAVGPETYYQPIVSQYHQPIDEANMVRRVQFPQYEQPQLIGLPNNSHAALVGAPYAEQVHHDILDPQLIAGEPQYQYSHYETVNPGYDAPRSYEFGGYPVTSQQYYEVPPAPFHHPGMATLTDGHNLWEDYGAAGAEFDEAFQKLS